MRPKLTIITPSYNQAAFIERTIRSVLDQGYENLEYLVVDGGSTDGSAEIIERYADRLAWWVSEPDDGQTDALNKGLRARRETWSLTSTATTTTSPGRSKKRWGARAAERALGGRRIPFRRRTRTTDGGLAAGASAGRRTGGSSAPGACRSRRPSGGARSSTASAVSAQDMHYVFDTEFGLRLVFAGEMPTLIDEELAVRVVHPEAKSWDRTPFEAEKRRFVELHAPSLRPR